MKIVFLLALASLASCMSVLPGGDQARNVEIEYTYIDESGKPIRVKVQSDLINLSGVREVDAKDPEPRLIQLATKLQEVKQEPVVQAYAAFAPATPEPEFRFVVQHPEPKTIEVKVPKPEVRTIYVQAPAPIPVGRKDRMRCTGT
ncbi:unnamed protein product [Meganyctiphanes norvegica]|uniref:Lipoprotein n=1 Tax=Meganyctiphanes norvegica TaxID=48144 RepID=A0AAV2RTV4_MEGNR